MLRAHRDLALLAITLFSMCELTSLATPYVCTSKPRWSLPLIPWLSMPLHIDRPYQITRSSLIATCTSMHELAWLTTLLFSPNLMRLYMHDAPKLDEGARDVTKMIVIRTKI